MTSLLAWLRTNILTGLFISLPIALTLYIFWAIITKLDGMLIPLVPQAYRPETWLGLDVPGTGIIAGIALMLVVGILARNFFGKKLVALGEWFLNVTPGINWLYKTIKQITETITVGQKDAFRAPCMVEYPRKGMWCIAFITGTTKGEIQKLTKNEMVNIFLPTTPNPTSGFLLFLPKKDVIELNMTVEEATKMIISAGIVTPETPAQIQANAVK